MKKIALICIALLASAAIAVESDNVQTRSLTVLERLGDIERIDVTAEKPIVEDTYNDEEVTRILEESEELEADSTEAQE